MDPVAPIERLIGVYDADGGLRGELAYVLGHLAGRAECALCDITHSAVRKECGGPPAAVANAEQLHERINRIREWAMRQTS